jgi:diacylglycerol kinase family enzyme
MNHEPLALFCQHRSHFRLAVQQGPCNIPMRIHAILNRTAGMIIGAGADVFERKLAETFKAAGHDITVETVGPKQIGARFQEAARRGYDALIVGGGDGSVNAAAAALLGSRTALGILPLGTLNRLAHDLGFSGDVDTVLRLLAEAEPGQIDVGEVNGHIFLCNSFIGLPRMVAERRQKLRGRPLAERLKGYVAMPMEIARGARRLAILVDDEDAARAHRALTVVVSNNAYSQNVNFSLKRRALDEGRLGLYISKHRTVLRSVWLLLRAALGFWKGDPDLEVREVRKVTIRTNNKRLKVSNDGELLTLETPLRYRIRPKALTVLMPKAHAA